MGIKKAAIAAFFINETLIVTGFIS